MKPLHHHCVDFIIFQEVVSFQIFLQFLEEMEVRWNQVWAVWWVVQDSEIKVATLLMFMCLCEALHCYVGGKPTACQVEHFEYMPSIF
jgi:hypothetical protein